MICTGTGSAPMRAMTERRRRRIALKEGGELMLFFGARARRRSFALLRPAHEAARDFIDINLAFSRVPGSKHYVQDLDPAARRRRRAASRRAHAFVYVCGLKAWRNGVTEAFRDLCRVTASTGTRCCRSSREQGRFHLETY